MNWKFWRKREPDSGLYRYAKTELERAGLFDEDSDYGGMLGDAALEIVALFAKQGHSGFSAEMTTSIVSKLMRYEPLTPLTFERDEWTESLPGTWQNRRKFSVFSDDNLATWYDLDEPGRPHHMIPPAVSA